MSYLGKPSTYVIGAVAILLYVMVWPMVAGTLFGRAGSGGQDGNS